jgi:hypothetical protein
VTENVYEVLKKTKIFCNMPMFFFGNTCSLGPTLYIYIKKKSLSIFTTIISNVK